MGWYFSIMKSEPVESVTDSPPPPSSAIAVGPITAQHATCRVFSSSCSPPPSSSHSFGTHGPPNSGSELVCTHASGESENGTHDDPRGPSRYPPRGSDPEASGQMAKYGQSSWSGAESEQNCSASAWVVPAQPLSRSYHIGRNVMAAARYVSVAASAPGSASASGAGGGGGGPPSSSPSPSGAAAAVAPPSSNSARSNPDVAQHATRLVSPFVGQVGASCEDNSVYLKQGFVDDTCAY